MLKLANCYQIPISVTMFLLLPVLFLRYFKHTIMIIILFIGYTTYST